MTFKKPLSKHWADLFAFRLTKQIKADNYNIGSGITPSGLIHLGNFREIFTAYLISQAVLDLNQSVNFYLSFDSFDRYRAVAGNYPKNCNLDYYHQAIDKPIDVITDPWTPDKTLVEARSDAFINELKTLDITPKYIHQHQKYRNGDYAKLIKKALDHTNTIKQILYQNRQTKVSDDWLPIQCYCNNCKKSNQKLSYDGNWNISSECLSCGHKDLQDLRTSNNIKLAWRTDWPMRWSYENTHFEPGGKDHSSDGGSYHSGVEIAKQVFNHKAPVYLGYDFVSIKGSQTKMSSSKGDVYTLTDCLKVYDPAMIKWIFSSNKPSHPFNISFDQDVFKVYDEFDQICFYLYKKTHSKLFNIEELNSSVQKKIEANQRIFKLCSIDLTSTYYNPGTSEDSVMFSPGFRGLCDRVQICGHDPNLTLNKFYHKYNINDHAKNLVLNRIAKASYWLKNSRL